jgi:dephospho-CoA kinase
MSRDRRLIIIAGQEGAGKSTIVRALLPHTRAGAVLDAEDVGQVNPCHFDEAFWTLLWDNVAALLQNFWHAGYTTVIAGSFIKDYADYLSFRARLDAGVGIYVVQLCASKPVRDERRIARSKPSSQEWRDELDRHFPEDTTLQDAVSDYRHIRIDNSALSAAETIAQISQAIPEAFLPE